MLAQTNTCNFIEGFKAHVENKSPGLAYTYARDFCIKLVDYCLLKLRIGVIDDGVGISKRAAC